ncbi:vWA domain-containing protein [Fusobacterium necrophorum]|uniref:vWA domain-containing protein n=1 Tax=Fusobacterium necrophorum TaxID=859 RepID=UPI00370DE8E4
MKKVIAGILVVFSLVACANVNLEKGKKNRSMELVFILDRSGSMSGLEQDTIGGYNSMLKKQKEQKGEVFVTTVLFDDKYEMLYHHKPIEELSNMTEKEYFVRGSTALYDAIGKTIVDVNREQSVAEKKVDQVLFIITTDGMENASQEFTAKKVKDLIETQKKEKKWEFLFLGANIDAIKTAESFGIEKEKAVNYHADSLGTQKNYKVLGEAVLEMRAGQELKGNWKQEIEEDYENRK